MDLMLASNDSPSTPIGYFPLPVAAYVPLRAPDTLDQDGDRHAWYKAHAVEGDCVFALRPTADTPADLRAAWARLLFVVQDNGKETAAHRARRDTLRLAWRRWRAGDPWMDLVEDGDVQRPAKARKARTCPHCGGRL